MSPHPPTPVASTGGTPARRWLLTLSQSQQGFTLLESMMAMLIITAVVVAITPPIFIAVAMRVQNRRAEQAMHLAQGEIDRVRVLVEQGKYTVNDLPAVIATSPGDITSVSAPTILSSTIKSNTKSNNTCDR